jgi:hypothetical protein
MENYGTIRKHGDPYAGFDPSGSKFLLRHSERQSWLGPTEIETGGLAPAGQRDRTSGAEPPMDASGDKESRTHKNSADAADHRNGTATAKTVQVCLMPAHYDQYPKDQEAHRFAD